MAEKADLESLEEAVGRAIHRIADLGKQNAKLQKELARAKKKATSAKSGGGPANSRTAEVRGRLERLEQDLGSLLTS